MIKIYVPMGTECRTFERKVEAVFMTSSATVSADISFSMSTGVKH